MFLNYANKTDSYKAATNEMALFKGQINYYLPGNPSQVKTDSFFAKPIWWIKKRLKQIEHRALSVTGNIITYDRQMTEMEAETEWIS